MKKLISLTIIVLLASCKKNLQNLDNNTDYYPYKNYFEKIDLIKVDITNPKLNFKGLVDSIHSIYGRDSIPYIEIKNKNNLRKIIPYRNDYGLFVERNILNITEDSILIDNNYSINDLNKILLRHFNNNGRIPYYSESTEKANIEISIDTNKMSSTIINPLNKLIDEFEKINSAYGDSLILAVGLNYSKQIPPPLTSK